MEPNNVRLLYVDRDSWCISKIPRQHIAVPLNNNLDPFPYYINFNREKVKFIYPTPIRIHLLIYKEYDPQNIYKPYFYVIHLDYFNEVFTPYEY